MLAASARGIGSCPITLHDEARAREVLGVPDDHRCRYAISLGFPNDEAEEEHRAQRNAAGMTGRKPLGEMVSYGRFRS
jgi:nitroreductase